MLQRHILPASASGATNNLSVESSFDFCVLVLDHPHNELEQMGLKWLQCGNGDYLNCNPDSPDVVSIFGYPGKEARENGITPLRISYGKEMPPPGLRRCPLFYDNRGGSRSEKMNTLLLFLGMGIS